MLGFGFLLPKMQKKITSSIPIVPLLRILLASIAVVPLLIVKPDVHVLMLLGSSVLIYLIALLLLRALTLDEIRSLFVSLRSPTKF